MDIRHRHQASPSQPAPSGRNASGAQTGPRVTTLAVATTLALLCLPGAREAQAQSIGALDVRSRLGERFFGAVPVKIESGPLDPRCIRVLPNPNAPDGAEALSNARIRIGSADSVIIETTGAVTSPIVALRLQVGCDNTVSRDFVVLGDIPNETAAPTQTATATPIAEPSPAPATVIGAPAPAAARPGNVARTAPIRRARPAEAPAMPALGPIEAATAPAAAAPVPPPAPAAAATAKPRPAPVQASGPAADLQTQNAKRLSELQARSDDQAAALLALEDRLALLQKQAELLKLQLEQALANAPAQGQASTAAVAPAPAATAGTPEQVAAATTAAAAAPAPAPAPAKAAATEVPPLVQQSPRKEPGMLDLLFDWRVGGGIAALLLGAVGFKMRRRPMLATETRKPAAATKRDARMSTTQMPAYEDPSMFDKTGEYPVASSYTPQTTAEWPSALQAPASRPQTAEWVPPSSEPPTTDNFPVPQPSMTTTQAMRTAPPTMSREFHITQQFQPSAERVVALSAPEEIVQQARTHYMDDGDLFKAIDLLEMAVSVRKDSARPWQALFAIYRRENMPERFQRLAMSYRSTFGEDENWPAVQALGRAMDPNNPIYAGSGVPDHLPDDLLERWIGVPLDFTAHLLANEMHDQLMSTMPGRRRRKKLAQ